MKEQAVQKINSMGKPSKRLVMDEGLFHYRNYLLGRRNSNSRIKKETVWLPLLLYWKSDIRWS